MQGPFLELVPSSIRLEDFPSDSSEQYPSSPLFDSVAIFAVVAAAAGEIEAAPFLAELALGRFSILLADSGFAVDPLSSILLEDFGFGVDALAGWKIFVSPCLRYLPSLWLKKTPVI